MARAKDTFSDAAESIRPFVERAMTDENLRRELMRAFGTARELYGDLVNGDEPPPVTLSSRVATDEEIRAKIGEAIGDLREASELPKAHRDRPSGKASTLVIAGIALAVLFNPVTGAETRKFIREIVSPSGDQTATREG